MDFMLRTTQSRCLFVTHTQVSFLCVSFSLLLAHFFSNCAHRGPPRNVFVVNAMYSTCACACASTVVIKFSWCWYLSQRSHTKGGQCIFSCLWLNVSSAEVFSETLRPRTPPSVTFAMGFRSSLVFVCMWGSWPSGRAKCDRIGAGFEFT